MRETYGKVGERMEILAHKFYVLDSSHPLKVKQRLNIYSVEDSFYTQKIADHPSAAHEMFEKLKTALVVSGFYHVDQLLVDIVDDLFSQ